MRISDWSSDVCSSDLRLRQQPSVACRPIACSSAAFLCRSTGGPALSCGRAAGGGDPAPTSHTGCGARSEEHTSELQSLMRISYAVFCLKKKKTVIINEDHLISMNDNKTAQDDKYT